MVSNKERFEKNIQRWAEVTSQDIEPIYSVQSSKIELVKEEGQENLKTVIDGEERFYHDKSGPLKEAVRWASTLSLKNTDVVFVYGVGLGYYFDALLPWLREKKERYIVFIEDDKEVMHRFFESERAETLLSHNQVRLFYIGELKKGVGKLSQLTSSFMGLSFKLSGLQFYLRNKAETLMRLHSVVSFLMKMYEVLNEELRHFSVPFFLNYYLNLFRLPSSYLANQMWGKWKGVPAIICGAGPSLNKNIEVLKGLQNNALVFAGSTAVNALNAAGMNPHFGVGIDPNPAQLVRVVSNHAFQTPYFVNYRMNSYALNALHGDQLYTNSGASYDVANWIDEKLGISGPSVMEGYNVANFALSLATMMGCDPIIVVGVDLAYSKEQSYAALTPSHPLYQGTGKFETKTAKEDLLARKDIHGETVFTLWKWLLESVWYSKFVMDYPSREIINATEGGIGFPGVENLTLAEVAEKHLTKEYDFEGLVHASIQGYCTIPEEVQGLKIQNLLRDLKESMNRAEKYCQSISSQYKQLIESISEGKKYPFSLVTDAVTEEVVKLDQEEAYQHILSVYSRHLMYVMQKEVQKLEIDKEWLEVDEVSQETAEIHAMRFHLLEEAAQKNNQLICNALGAHEGQVKREQAFTEISQKEVPLIRVESSSDDTYHIEDGQLVIKDHFLKISIEEPFKGDAFSHIEEKEGEAIRHQGYYLEGRLHGPSCYFGEDEELLSTSWYYQGKRVGKTERYYKDGALYSVTNYLDDKAHGPQDFYYKDGKVRSQINYDKGVLHGPLFLFFQNGQLKREIHYKLGQRDGKETLWNFSGQKIGELEYKEDIPVGVGRFWTETGALVKEITYTGTEEEGTIKLWNASGQAIELPKDQGRDYFDIVTLKMEDFTKSLEQIATSLNEIGPILEKQFPESETKAFRELENELTTINEEVTRLIQLNKKMKSEAGLDGIKGKEAIWKTPTAKEALQLMMQQMVAHLQEHIVVIQNAFIDTLQVIVAEKEKK